jgi:hypothetical protein
MHVWTTRILSAALIILSCWTPELAAALPAQDPNLSNQQSTAQTQTAVGAAKLEDVLPDAPSQQQPNTAVPSGSSSQAPSTDAQQTAPTPDGTAAARAAKVIGGPASKPAGSAIAPAKQRQTRSLLIKLGVIAGAGLALGTVYALSRSAPNRPPGTH